MQLICLQVIADTVKVGKSIWNMGLTLRPLLAAKNLLPPISLTVLTLTLKNYPWKPSGTILNVTSLDHIC